MKYSKNIQKIIFVLVIGQAQGLCAAQGTLLRAAQQFGHHSKNFGHQAKNLGKEIVTNKKALIGAGLGWGAVSGAWYGGMKYSGDFNPEVAPKYTIPTDVLKKSGLDAHQITYVANPTIFNTKDAPEERWLANGKGFWGNLASWASPAKPYMGSDGKLRVSENFAKELSEHKGVDEFVTQVSDQKGRHETAFDYKTCAECALSTALWTPVFMLSPVTNALKGATAVAAYMVPASFNRMLIAAREKMWAAAMGK